MARASSPLGETEVDPARLTTRMIPLERPGPAPRRAAAIAPLAPPEPRSVYARRSALLPPPPRLRRPRATLRVDDIKAGGGERT